ncbi:hypothetical protein GCM10009754_58670 [Amycolatopsis minnesotensis]|uniref:Uncharacterized protein n=2 Tax=Amycolatopsis minnesotensis TaxID=337894 RepID=A0ABP5DAQ8_9PSEU
MVTAALAALVTAGTLTGVAVLRHQSEAPSTLGAPAAAVPSGVTQCGAGSCQVVASQQVDGKTADLLADSNGDNGKLRVGGPGSPIVVETSTSNPRPRLNGESLSCVTASVSACLVRGPSQDWLIGQVVVSSGDNWRPAEASYLSDAGAITLHNVLGDDAPELIVAKKAPCASPAACRSAPVYAQVYDLTGTSLGCTRQHQAASALRGWPDIAPVPSDVRSECP